MAYAPLNQLIFEAAFSGALAGMGVSGRVISSASSAAYTGLAQIAGAFAQAVDTAWTAAPANNVEVNAMLASCEAAWEDRCPPAIAPNLTPATYTIEAAAICAAVQSDIAYFAAQGITPSNVQLGGGECFTYRQGGVAANNVYTTFLAAYNAALVSANANGLATLVIDDSLGAPVTGNAGVLDLSNIFLQGRGSAIPGLVFQTGTTVLAGKFRGITRIALSSTSAAPVATMGAGTVLLPLYDFSRITGGAAAPFFNLTAAAVLVVLLGDLSSFVNGTDRVVQAAAGCTCIVDMVGAGCALGTTTLGGAGSFTAAVYSASAIVPTAEANVTGTYAVNPLCLLTNMDPPIQSGTALLVAGTVTVAATITANTRIVVTQKTPAGTALTTGYIARGSARVVGAPGSFTIEAIIAAGTINVADGSNIDWIAIG